MMLSVDNSLVITLSSYVDNFGTFQKVMCLLTAFLKTYFVWVNLLLTVFLIFHFFFFAVLLKDIRRYEVIYVMFSVIFPMLFVWVPFINNNYGPVGNYCWIKNKNSDGTKYQEGLIEQYTLLYGPVGLFLIICIPVAFIVTLVLAWKGCCQKISDDNEPLINRHYKQHKKALMELLPLLAYPAIFFCFNAFIIGRRVYDYVSPVVNYKLALGQAYFLTLWGILTSAALLFHIVVHFSVKIRTQTSHIEREPRTGENRTVNYTT